MPSEPSKDDFPIGLLLLLAIGAFTLLRAPDATDGKSSLGSETAKVFPALKANYKALCLEAADLVEKKQLANEEALAKWLAPRTGAARDSAFAGFYQKLNEALPVEFEGKEAEVAGTLRKIAGAW
jgi:hypothetical protein